MKSHNHSNGQNCTTWCDHDKQDNNEDELAQADTDRGYTAGYPRGCTLVMQAVRDPSRILQRRTASQPQGNGGEDVKDLAVSGCASEADVGPPS